MPTHIVVVDSTQVTHVDSPRCTRLASIAAGRPPLGGLGRRASFGTTIALLGTVATSRSEQSGSGGATEARRLGLFDRALKPFGDVQAGEGGTALLMCLNVHLLLVAYYILKTVREPLILATGGAEVKSGHDADLGLYSVGAPRAPSDCGKTR